MIFSTQLSKKYPLDILEPDIKQQIYFNILAFKPGTNELILNEVCKNRFNKTLKQVCAQLVNNCKVTLNGTQVIITFKTIKDEQLAAFITYGDAQYQGSSILQKSFNNAYERSY